MKKPAIMTKVHIVRVIKVCFFFSYSDSGGLSDFCVNSGGLVPNSMCPTTRNDFIWAHSTDLLGNGRRLRGAIAIVFIVGQSIIFCGIARIRLRITDIGRHAQATGIRASTLKPDVAARLGHDWSVWNRRGRRRRRGKRKEERKEKEKLKNQDEIKERNREEKEEEEVRLKLKLELRPNWGWMLIHSCDARKSRISFHHCRIRQIQTVLDSRTGIEYPGFFFLSDLIVECMIDRSRLFFVSSASFRLPLTSTIPVSLNIWRTSLPGHGRPRRGLLLR